MNPILATTNLTPSLELGRYRRLAGLETESRVSRCHGKRGVNASSFPVTTSSKRGDR